MTMALPSLPGGTASKVADLYEAAWTVDRLLDLLAGEITELHLEPPGEDGLGVEFYTVLPPARASTTRSSAKRRRLRAPGPPNSSPTPPRPPAGAFLATSSATSTGTIKPRQCSSVRTARETCGNSPSDPKPRRASKSSAT